MTEDQLNKLLAYIDARIITVSKRENERYDIHDYIKDDERGKELFESFGLNYLEEED